MIETSSKLINIGKDGNKRMIKRIIKRELMEKNLPVWFIVFFGLVHVFLPWVPGIIVSTSFGNILIHKALIFLMGIATLACVFSSYFCRNRMGRAVFLVLSIVLVPAYILSAFAETNQMMEWSMGGEWIYVVLAEGDILQVLLLFYLFRISWERKS